jgi:hypothetical protein
MTDPGVLGLDDLLARPVTVRTDDAQQLVDGRRRWFTIIQECVREDAGAALTALATGDTAAHSLLHSCHWGMTQAVPPLGAPFDPAEGPLTHAARALASLGAALVLDGDEGAGHLRAFHAWAGHARLDVACQPVRKLPVTVRTRHSGRIQNLIDRGDLDLLSLLWMIELDGGIENNLKRFRTTTESHVLLDRGFDGVTATLKLVRLPGLPDGLLPHPADMALVSGDVRFHQSRLAAWQVVGWEQCGTIMWSVTDLDGPVNRVVGQSLGLAFSVLLGEQRRLRSLVRSLAAVRRLTARTSIVGRLDPDDPDRVASVGGYDTKLGAALEGSRIIFPRSDEEAVEKARVDNKQLELVPVSTRRKAASKARSVERRRLLSVALVCAMLATVAGFWLYRSSDSQVGESRQRAEGASLVAKALSLRTSNPLLAAKLGLAAHYIDPTNEEAVDAMRDVLTDHHDVVRTLQADPAEVDAIGVSDTYGRILTSGSLDSTDVWDTSTGRMVGQIREKSSMITTGKSQAIAAAATENGVTLYDFGSSTPRKLGDLPASTCTDRNAGPAAMRFTGEDNSLIVVWQDATVTRYDPVTRTQTSCQTALQTLAPLTFTNPLPVQKVVSADIVPASSDTTTNPATSAGDEVVVLLSNNQVVSDKIGSGQAHTEVAPAELTGRPELVAASADTVSVATSQGVAVWQRNPHALLANPAGGFGFQARAITNVNDNLLISGDQGTALVPLATQSRLTFPVEVSTLSGGAATTSATDSRTIVAGGPDGRVYVLADSAGELALGQESRATAIEFLPTGHILTADVPVGEGGTSDGTLSDGLADVDPRRKLTSQSAASVVAQWTDTDHRRFYVNDVASSRGMVAAAGQVSGQAAVLVWRSSGSDPTMLTMASPDDPNKVPAIIANVGFTSDGKYLIGRHVNGTVSVWSTSDFSLVRTIRLTPGNPRMALDGDTGYFVEGTDGQARLSEVDLTSGKTVRSVPRPNLTLLTTGARGTQVVTMTIDEQIQVLNPDLTKRGPSWRPLSNGGLPYDVQLSPDGKRLAIAQGNSVLIYDSSTQTLSIPPLSAGDDVLLNVSWSPDSQLIAGSPKPPDHGGKNVDAVRVWQVGDLDWASEVCGFANGGLSRQEWLQYVDSDFTYVDLCSGRKS